MKDKQLWIKVHEVGEAHDGGRGTSHRVDGLVWATVEMAAHALEVTRSDLVNEILVEGLAERGFFALRVHGSEQEREAFGGFIRSYQGAQVFEHGRTDVLEELVVRLPVES